MRTAAAVTHCSCRKFGTNINEKERHDFWQSMECHRLWILLLFILQKNYYNNNKNDMSLVLGLQLLVNEYILRSVLHKKHLKK